MNRWRALVAGLCLWSAFLSPVMAQKGQADAEKEALEEQAVELTNAIAAGIPSLRSADNRIFLTSAVVDLLWVKDEKRARELFESVTGEIAAAMASLKPAEQKSHNRFNVLQQQRREIVERMAGRDPDLALTFLRGTRPPAGMVTKASDYSSETNLELHLASLIAQKDPETALKIARANLRQGVTYSTTSILFNLAVKSPDAARTFHDEIVAQLRSVDLRVESDASSAAWSLLGSFLPPQSNEETYRSLVELFATTVLSMKPDARGGSATMQNAAGQISSYLPQFEKYAPGRVAALRQWTLQIRRTRDPGTQIYDEFQELMQKGTVEDLLALVGKYSQDYHLQIYQNAVQKALATGDASRARQIINEYVIDGPQRTQMLEQLDNQLFWKSANENKIAEAMQVLERVKVPEQRFQLLMSLASNLTQRGEPKQATSLLAEAAALIEGLPRNSQKLTAQLQLAQAYSAVDSQQSVALLGRLIPLVNQLIEAAAVLDGYENSYLNEGEWMRRGHTSLGNLVNSIGQNLGALARIDLEGARSLSNQIERPEIRLMAQLEIAQSLLREGNTRSRNFSRLNQVLHRFPDRH